MDTQNLIDSLVDTYRQLNINFRNANDSAEARSVVARMRDDEIAFSQALKDHITGIGTADGEENEVVDGADRTLAQIISQFGSARATTLNLLKGLTDDSAWSAETSDGRSLRDHVQELVESDRNQLQKLGSVIGV